MSKIDLGSVSAFDIAVKNGYAGTEADWVNDIANAAESAVAAQASATQAEESATQAAEKAAESKADYTQVMSDFDDLSERMDSLIAPSARVNQVSSGAEIVITDKDGTTTAMVQNGTATDAQVNEWLNNHPEATTTVEDGSISEQKFSDEVIEKLGWGATVKDRTYDFSSLATSRLVRWINGTIETSNPNCVEFSFDIATVKANMPSGLATGAVPMLFGTGNDTLYYAKYLVDHDGTKVNHDNYTNRTGIRMIPTYSDLDTVNIYVFKQSGTPTSEDIETMQSYLIAKAVDTTCGKSFSFKETITPSYGIDTKEMTVYAMGDVHIKTVRFAGGGITSFTGFPIRVYDSLFTVVSGVEPTLNNLNLSTGYIWWTQAGDKNNSPNTFDDIPILIPNKENIVYFGLPTSKVTDETVILDDKGQSNEPILSEDDILAIRKMYPFLGEFKGVYDRFVNRGGAVIFSSLSNPPVNSNPGRNYQDILLNGTDGDWYVYQSANDLKIKNGIATFGDIVYRKNSTTILPLNNPFKFGNHQTKPESEYDVVIVGGGAGGIGAAYALRNSGLRVLVADKMEGLGGTHTQAGLHSMISSPVGDWFKTVCEDAYKCSAMRFFTYHGSTFVENPTFDDYWDVSLAYDPNSSDSWQLLFNENWLTRKYHTDLTDGGVEIRYKRKFLSHNDFDGTITSLTFLNLFTGAEEKVFAKVVIDCTGDVYVGRYNRTLDTDFFIGTDAYSKYNESAASNIQVGDHNEINTPEIMYRYSGYSAGSLTDDYIAFTSSDEYADKEKDFPVISGVDNKFNGAYNSVFYADPGESVNPFTNGSSYPNYYTTMSPDYHCGITKQMLVEYGEERLHEISDRYARAHHKVRNGTGAYYMGSYPLLAIREGYRMNCEYMVTQADIEDTITSDNYAEKQIVALSTWYADIHQNTVVKTSDIANTYKNGIPYLAMVPTSYKNLLVACRGYGASHIGLSGIRLIKCMMSLGRAAGVAAKQCVENVIRDVRDVDVAQVQADAGVGELLTYLEENVYPHFNS